MTAADDFRELMGAHDTLLLIALAMYPENPEIAELVAHEELSELLGLEVA